VDHEVIHVRGGKDVTLDVQSTAHGPLLNPIFTRETRPIALKWTLYDPALNTLPLYQMNVASNWAEFSAALATWSWPTQNVVYTDDQGHIAYQDVGRVPLRPAGLQGVPIQDAAHEWQGYIPFDALPGAVRSALGFSSYRQLPRNHGQVSLLADAGVGIALPRRAHLQVARRA
jgi:penicillin amidase